MGAPLLLAATGAAADALDTEAAAGDGADAVPSSRVMTRDPSDRLSPTLTLTSFTMPECDDGTSMVALSDSSTTMDCSFSILSPALTKTSITGTSL